MALPKSTNSQFAMRAAVLGCRQQSPFTDPEVFARRAGDRVLLWTWSKSRVALALAENTGAPSVYELVPETALHLPGSGIRFARGVDGVEAQHWQNGILVASQWWGGTPSNAERAMFLRSQGESADDTIALIETAELTSEYVGNAATSKSIVDRVGLVPLALALGLILLLPSLYLAGRALSLSESLTIAKASAVDPSLRMGAQARERALTLAARVRAIDDLERFVNPLEILNVVQPVLTQQGVKITSWESREQVLSLEVRIGSAFPLEPFVRALNETPLLNDVSINPGRAAGTLVIRASMARLAVPQQTQPSVIQP